MINPKELRVGNLVEYNENICVITDIHGYMERVHLEGAGNGNPVHVSKLKGIPLTEEWLKQCGFIESIDEDDEEEISALFNSGIKIMHFFLAPESTGYYYDNGTFEETHIKYVHQLQNLYFALTYKELEIKEVAK